MHLITHFILRQRECRARCTDDILPRHAVAARLPLVIDRAKTIRISQAVARREELPLPRRTDHRDRARRGIVDVSHESGHQRGQTLGITSSVNVADLDTQQLANRRLTQ